MSARDKAIKALKEAKRLLENVGGIDEKSVSDGRAAHRALNKALRLLTTPEPEAQSQALLRECQVVLLNVQAYLNNYASPDVSNEVNRRIDGLLPKLSSAPAQERGRMEEKPVAWRVKDYADGWMLFDDEAFANRVAVEMGARAVIQALYIQPASPPPPSSGEEPEPSKANPAPPHRINSAYQDAAPPPQREDG